MFVASASAPPYSSKEVRSDSLLQENTSKKGLCQSSKEHKHVPTHLETREEQEFCSEAFVHIGDDLRFRPGGAIPIDVFPANEKFSLSPVNIPQVFIQTFCVWIIGASYV